MFKLTMINLVILTFISLNSVKVQAKTPAFQVAVIENAQGSPELLAGNFSKGVAKLAANDQTQTSFDISTGLCVAYLKSDLIDEAELACTLAIKQIESQQNQRQSTKYLTSLSYSNRGISRYVKNDINGALDDLTTAILIDSNPITQSNLHTAKKYLLKDTNNTLVTLAN